MQEVKEKIVGRKIKAPEWPRMPAQGLGCPVSFKGQGIETSGINELSQLFLDLYKRILSIILSHLQVVLYRPALKIFETSLKYLSIFKTHPYRHALKALLDILFSRDYYSDISDYN